ncbi:MAG: hypothetical protein AB4426_08690 [Xenococcaceae cyanobacterium]
MNQNPTQKGTSDQGTGNRERGTSDRGTGNVTRAGGAGERLI